LLGSIAVAALLAFAAKESSAGTLRPWDELFGVAITPFKAFIVGGEGLLLTSSDNGASWSRRLLAASGGGRPVSDRDLFSISFDQSGLHGWIAGADGLILASDDAGETWHKQASGTNDALFKSVAIGSRSACVAGENGTIECTNDGGLHWLQGQGVPPISFFDITFTDRNTGWASGEFQTVLSSSDGGLRWKVAHSADSTSFEIPPYFSVVPSGPGALLVTEQGGGALSTRNDGQTWNAVALPSANSILAGAYCDSLGVSRGLPQTGTLSLVGKHGTILLSVNGGISWHTVGLSPADLNDVEFGKSYGLIVGMQGTVLRTPDAVHWSKVN